MNHPLPPSLPIQPFTKPVRGNVTLPGSKSITNRALILAALGKTTVTLRGALFSRDTRIMVAALQQLGFKVETDEKALTIRIEGRDGEIPNREAKIDVGNAGTAARFLTAFVCLRPDGVYHFDGDEAMRRRPIGALLQALESQGAKASSRSFPFTLRTAGLRGGIIELDASESSQMLSALLMVAPVAAHPVIVRLATRVREPFVEMTRNLMEHFGAQVGNAVEAGAPAGYHVPNSRYLLPAGVGNSVYQIEPDATAASYFLALPLVTRGSIKLNHITSESLQGDVVFADVLKRVGLHLSVESASFVASYDGGRLQAIGADFSEFSDTFLTLAAIAPLLNGPTKISGIAHTRKQETDRVAGMARELKKLGQQVIETEDSLEIHPRPLMSGVEIETYHDHRFAMSFGVLGCHDLHGNGLPWLTIKDPACCAKTFPEFFDLLDRLRAGSH